ncbi:outer membrane beta-barrel protein [Flavobacterium caeni]|uniref:Outer membrane protein beta-barrel domain-containing protein n=1 Tax=Flavobacterium caeni TaxID=490189 RepID=A0A1G5H632_9FLAO|nr:outer membrane beta-barrel protein [Flavobacterium caeni]SCY59335.1 Outer membrane protein beta-barrel domain-containing protein [Flavobacterium caeni]
MKKMVTAALLLFGFAALQAQVTFRPGIRAGVNFSHFTQGDLDMQNGAYTDSNTGLLVRVPNDEFNSKTDFYVGLYGALRLTRFYTLQPEVNYSRQGTKFDSYRYDSGIGATRKISGQIDLSYVSVGIVNKFTFSNTFNIHVGPTIDVIMERSGDLDVPFNTTNDYYYDAVFYDTNSDVDLSFVLGLGINFTKNFGFEARVKKGIIPVMDWGDDHTNVVFSAGLVYTFDVSGATGSTN